jgi:PAS domain S-box-containing protein
MEGVKVLVVDDTPQNLVTLEAVLDDGSIEVVGVRSAREALRAVLDDEFAAILLDVNMPDMDGFEAAALIRARPLSAHTPILFVTAYAGETQLSRAYSLGAVDFIQSPVDPAILRAKVGVFADLFQKRAEIKRQTEQLREAEERLRHQAESALRESEDRFRVLCTSAPVAIFQLDATGRCVYVSPLWEPTTGQADVDALGFGWAEAVSPGRAAPLLASWREALHEGRGWSHEEAITRRRDEPKRWLYVKASPILAEHGESVGHVGTVEDITARKQTEEQLLDADRRKDEFLAMLAHELRNPLAAIGNAALVARSPGLEHKREWSMDVISRQVGQLSKLIDDLMDASRVRLGKIELRRDRLDLTGVLQRAIDAVLPDADARNQKLVRHVPSAGAICVIGDTTRLEQVFVNLLSNAIKYSHDGQVITISASYEDERVVVSVRDNGIGLDPAVADRIFDLFVQGHTSLDRAHGGLGIGLSLARRLTELHGGTVAARSDGPGRGAEFVVSLPATTAEPLAEPGPNGLVGTSNKGRNKRVLVVDDNVDAASALGLLLESAGFSVVLAHDGQVALTRATESRPDIVLMDLGLPVLDGYQVAAELRNQPGGDDLMLVAVSGYGPGQDYGRAATAGFDHHLVKPVDCVALLHLLIDEAGPRRRRSDLPRIAPRRDR